MESAFHTVRRLLGADTAAECKAHTEGQIARLKAEADALVGKEHHKQRAAKGRLIRQLRLQDRYIDACFVVRGLSPKHGNFRSEAATQRCGMGPPDSEDGDDMPAATLPPEEAARLAAQAQAALKRLEQRSKEEKSAGGAGSPAGQPRTFEDQLQEWRRRAARLEAKLAEPMELRSKSAADLDEFDSLAQEVVSFRQKLKDKNGNRAKLPAAELDLQLLEARLDTLAGAFLPAEEAVGHGVGTEAEELRQWERRLVAKIAQYNQSTSGLSPSAAKEVEQLLKEIAELKAQLGAEGLTEHEQDKDERVLLRSTRLAELRQYDRKDKKQERKEREELDSLRGEVDKLKSKIETHKRRLRDEKKLSQKEVRQDPEVCELEERLATLQKMVGGA
mmetsp:Transcript_21911/g.62602  ORF Transcript_21911/g.62602 Transcript_21911/m.62602 type:complete len:390 (+) Transcript_21911:71-1240(+)